MSRVIIFLKWTHRVFWLCALFMFIMFGGEIAVLAHNAATVAWIIAVVHAATNITARFFVDKNDLRLRQDLNMWLMSVGIAGGLIYGMQYYSAPCCNGEYPFFISMDASNCSWVCDR